MATTTNRALRFGGSGPQRRPMAEGFAARRRLWYELYSASSLAHTDRDDGAHPRPRSDTVHMPNISHREGTVAGVTPCHDLKSTQCWRPRTKPGRPTKPAPARSSSECERPSPVARASSLSSAGCRENTKLPICPPCGRRRLGLMDGRGCSISHGSRSTA